MVITKIEKHKLEARVIALFNDGKSTHEIATVLNTELNGEDTISQSTVARFVKTIREDTRDATRQFIHDHIKKNVESDLETLDEIESYFVQIFRNKEKNPEYNYKIRADFGLKALRVIETKLRYALTDPAGGKDSHHPVDLDQFKNDLEDIKEQQSCDG